MLAILNNKLNFHHVTSLVPNFFKETQDKLDKLEYNNIKFYPFSTKE